MITYQWKNNTSLSVYLDGKYTGAIKGVGVVEERNGGDLKLIGIVKRKEDISGWQYFPKGQKEGGEVFKTVSDAMQSLEDE